MKIKVLLLSFLFSSLAYAQTYSILLSPPTLEPVHFLNEEGKYVGFEVDLLSEIEKREGITLNRNISSSFSQSMRDVRDGKVDAFIDSISITPERQKIYGFSVSYMLNNTVIVSKDTSIHSLEDLKNKKVSVYTGTSHEKMIEELKGEDANDGSIFRENTTFLALRDVVQGKTDAMIGDEIALRVMVNRYQKYGLISIVDPHTEQNQFGILLHKDNTELKEKFDHAILQMKADGTLDALIKKWWETL